MAWRRYGSRPPLPPAHRPSDRTGDAGQPEQRLDRPTAIGTALDSRNVTRYLRRHLERLSLPHQRFHDLRHAFATLQLEAGAQLLEVSRALGHTDIGTTANVYAHWTDAMAARTAERMAGILGAAGG